MPQPDVVLTREPRGKVAVPLRSVALLVEVSSTTLLRDLGRKAEVYAKSGIAEYWVVDIEARVIHQLWTPITDGYAERREIGFGEQIAAVTIAGLQIGTDAL